MPRLSLSVAVAVSLPLVSSGQVLAATYVDADSRGGPCSDARTASEAGSAKTPWCSLERAIAAAPPGSTVLVRAGSYPELEVIERDNTELVTVKAYRGERPVVDGIDVQGSDRWRFEGFRITAMTHLRDLSNGVQLAGNEMSPKGVFVRAGRQHLIEGNHIHHMSWSGAREAADGYGINAMGNDDTSVRVQDLTIRNNRFDHISADAIQFGSVRGALIEGNDISEVRDFMDVGEHNDGIQMYGTSHDVTIRNNFFHDTIRMVIAKGYSYERLVIENNLGVRMDPGSTALNIYDAPGVRVVNNTIWGIGAAVRFRDDPDYPTVMSDAVVMNNILDGLQGHSYVAYEDYNLLARRDSDDYGTHDLFGTPSFVNPAAGDYSLRAGAPGVDAGTSANAAPAQDRLSRQRMDDPRTPNSGGGLVAHFDIGSEERVGLNAAQLAVAEVARALRRLGARKLARRRSRPVRVRIQLPSAGRLALRVVSRMRGRHVVVATARRRFAAAGTNRVALRIRRRARRGLRRGHRVPLRVRVRFVPAAGRGVVAGRTLSLPR
jgi:Right handed beta helix region